MKTLKANATKTNFVAKTRDEAIAQWVNVIVERRRSVLAFGNRRRDSIARIMVRYAVARLRQIVAAEYWPAAYHSEEASNTALCTARKIK